MERKVRAATLSGVLLAIVAGALVLLNVAMYGCSKRLDMTKTERFTLSQGSGRLVRDGLKQEMTADLYVTRGLPKQDAFIEDLTDLLAEYEKASAGKFKYRVLEPKTDKEREDAKTEGLEMAAFGEGSETGDQATITKGYLGLVFKYGSEKATIPLLSPDQTQGLEFWITNKIREIRDRADDISQRIGVVTGKDEIKLTDGDLVPPQGGRPGPSMKAILQQALPFYKLEDVDLKEGNEKVDEELRGLIITQPGKDYTDKELRRIDEFLMKGNKALLVVAGAVNMKANDATMTATLNTHGHSRPRPVGGDPGADRRRAHDLVPRPRRGPGAAGRAAGGERAAARQRVRRLLPARRAELPLPVDPGVASGQAASGHLQGGGTLDPEQHGR
jgi:ABC-type uncharacterized transport system involved in gliding motility auxiliary subunit